MDFIRLAMREVRRNGSRTAIGIAAMALATVILVLSRIVPQGYMRNEAIAERIFAGADILVWPAPAHVYAGDSSQLEWREWQGDEWQTFAEYFIPSLLRDGYVCPSSAPPWRPLDAGYLSGLLADLDGVAKVEPYLAYPCEVSVGSITERAILRGREPDSSPNPLALEGQIKSGRALTPSDNGTMNALIPLVSDPPLPYLPGGDVTISIPPAPDGWDAALPDTANSSSPHVLKAVGAYVVKLGEIPGMLESRSPGPTSEPKYWLRPEVVVTADTFRKMVSPHLPVYQLLVTVSRTSETKATVQRIRERLGSDYAVFSIAELAVMRDTGGGQKVISKDMSPVVTAMIVTMAAAIVAGQVYVLLALQTRKIGLLRAIGATSRDLSVYVLSVIAYMASIGTGIGLTVGKLLTLLVLSATDFSFAEWLRMTAFDAFLASSGLGISVFLGLAVALWASRIPCAEVLRRE